MPWLALTQIDRLLARGQCRSAHKLCLWMLRTGHEPCSIGVRLGRCDAALTEPERRAGRLMVQAALLRRTAQRLVRPSALPSDGSRQTSPWTDLPADCAGHVAERLYLRDMLALRCTCHCLHFALASVSIHRLPIVVRVSDAAYVTLTRPDVPLAMDGLFSGEGYVCVPRDDLDRFATSQALPDPHDLRWQLLWGFRHPHAPYSTVRRPELPTEWCRRSCSQIVPPLVVAAAIGSLVCNARLEACVVPAGAQIHPITDELLQQAGIFIYFD